MGMMIPSELDFVLDLLGYEWPNIDEDALRDAAVLTRGLRDDLQATLDALDSTINNDLSEAFKSKSARSYIQAFTDNRTQNMDQLIELLPGVAGGIEIFADVVLALKIKVIAELVITAAQIAAAAATAVFTLGASLAANAAIIAVRKKALDILTDLMIDELVGQLLPLVLEPLSDTLVGYLEGMLSSPITTSTGDYTPRFDVSFALMDALADAIDDCGSEQEEVLGTYFSKVMSLPILAG